MIIGHGLLTLCSSKIPFSSTAAPCEEFAHAAVAALPLGLGLPAGVMLLFCAAGGALLLVQMQVGKISLPVIVLLDGGFGFAGMAQLGTIIGRDGGISLPSVDDYAEVLQLFATRLAVLLLAMLL